MQAYVAQASPAATLLTISAGNDSVELHRKLDRALTSATRPTLLFSLLQSHSFSILLHLLEHGHRVPAQVSLIARDLHPLLESARPDLAHYSRPTSQLVSRTLRLTQALLAGRSVPAQPSLITPVFIAGRTLAAPAPAR
jgi:DNA-binding LacI/PurR family transcriptional regulator